MWDRPWIGPSKKWKQVAARRCEDQIIFNPFQYKPSNHSWFCMNNDRSAQASVGSSGIALQAGHVQKASSLRKFWEPEHAEISLPPKHPTNFAHGDVDQLSGQTRLSSSLCCIVSLQLCANRDGAMFGWNHRRISLQIRCFWLAKQSSVHKVSQSIFSSNGQSGKAHWPCPTAPHANAYWLTLKHQAFHVLQIRAFGVIDCHLSRPVMMFRNLLIKDDQGQPLVSENNFKKQKHQSKHTPHFCQGASFAWVARLPLPSSRMLHSGKA